MSLAFRLRSSKRLRILLLGAGSAAAFAGMTDAAAQMLGAGERRTLLAGAILLLAAGWGARRPRSGKGDALALLWLLAAGALLPRFAVPVASWASGPLLATSGLFTFLALVVSLGWPAMRLGGMVAHQAATAGAKSWNALFAGALAGHAVAVGFGLGLLGYAGAILLLVVAVFLGVPEGTPPGPDEDDADPTAWRTRTDGWLARFAPALLGASAVFGTAFVFLHLAAYDSNAGYQVLGRWLALGVLALLGALTLGEVVAEYRFGSAVAALLSVALAAAWMFTASTLDGLADPGRVAGTLTSGEVLLLVKWTGRLDEDRWLYAPVLALQIAGAAVVLGIALRAGLGGGSAGASVRRFSWLLMGAGAAGAARALGHPAITAELGELAWTAALGAAVCAALGAARPGPLLRFPVVAAAIAATVYFGGLPVAPRSSVVMPEPFEYMIASSADAMAVEQPEQRGERRGVGSLARVVERQAGERIGRWVLADDRNFLTPAPSLEALERRQVLMAAAWTSGRTRALLVGAPHPGTLAELRGIGFQEIHVVCQPPELVEVAAAFHPAWRGVQADGVHNSPAAVRGRFDLVLLREPAPWSRRRDLLNRSMLAVCRAHLTDGGVLAVVVDPARSAAGTTGSAASLVAEQCASVEICLVPDALHPPRLLVLGTGLPVEPEIPKLLAIALQANGMPAQDAGDLRSLRLGRDLALGDAPELPVDGPLNRAVPLQAMAVRELLDDVDRQLRAGAELAAWSKAFESAAHRTLLGFYAGHLGRQLRSTEDAQFVEAFRQIDLHRPDLDTLLALAQGGPEDRVVQAMWDEVLGMLADKREVEWVEYYSEALQQIGWNSPDILLAQGRAALEMLDVELAIERAREVLAARPGDPVASVLRARGYFLAERHKEAADAFESIYSEQLELELLELREWALAAQAAGREEQARQLAWRLHDVFGKEALGRDLARLLKIELDPSGIFHPERD